MEGDGIDGIEVVGAVEVHVEAAHHHDELMIGVWPALLRVDDERAVEALGDVLGQRRGVAVVEVQAERLGVELVDEPFARIDQPGGGVEDAIHAGGMDAMEVDAVRVRAAVDESDAHAVALTRANRRTRDATVVGPGGELDTRDDLDGFVEGVERVLAQGLSVGQRAHLPAVEVGQDLGGVEAVARVIYLADYAW